MGNCPDMLAVNYGVGAGAGRGTDTAGCGAHGCADAAEGPQLHGRRHVLPAVPDAVLRGPRQQPLHTVLQVNLLSLQCVLEWL